MKTKTAEEIRKYIQKAWKETALENDNCFGLGCNAGDVNWTLAKRCLDFEAKLKERVKIGLDEEGDLCITAQLDDGTRKRVSIDNAIVTYRHIARDSKDSVFMSDKYIIPKDILKFLNQDNEQD